MKQTSYQYISILQTIVVTIRITYAISNSLSELWLFEKIEMLCVMPLRRSSLLQLSVRYANLTYQAVQVTLPSSGLFNECKHKNSRGFIINFQHFPHYTLNQCLNKWNVYFCHTEKIFFFQISYKFRIFLGNNI